MAKRMLVMFAVVAVTVLGCDPVRTTVQKVVVELRNTESRDPIASAVVELKLDYDRAPPGPDSIHKTEEWKESLRAYWDEIPWDNGATDEAGIARITIETTMIDRSRGSTPPQSADAVSGNPFKLRVYVNETDEPIAEFSLLMKPGESAESNRIAVSVVEVTSPAYKTNTR